jgi:tetratricopeptide (TPR) repeat protein
LTLLATSTTAGAESEWGEVLFHVRQLRSAGRTQEAEAALLAAWNKAERSGAGSQWVAALCHHLGLIYFNSARYDEAEKFFTRALRNWELTTSSNPVELVTTANGLASLYLTQRRYARTEALFHSAAGTVAETLGSDDPERARWRCNWASVLFYRGDLEDAELIYRESLRTWEKAFGLDNADVATALNNLGATYLRMKRLDDALRCFERVRAITEKRGLRLVRPLLNLAGVYTAVHREGEAEVVYRQALQEVEAVNGPDHPLMAEALERYAAALRQWRRKGEAAKLHQQAKAILARSAQNTPAQQSVDVRELTSR